MDTSSLFRGCLESGDFRTLRDVWSEVMPHLPPLGSDGEAEATLHQSRTAANSIAFRLRAYSHRWLTERGIPSQLPDALRPRAERLYPTVVEAVGIAVKPHRLSADHAAAVRGAMEDAVLEKYAEGDRDPVRVAALMKERADRVRAQ